MAKVLNDVELKRLFGTVIVDGNESSIRPNSYILRLGAQGEFLNTCKEFELGAPVGMRDKEWEDASVSGGPEEMLDNLLKSGYPWQLLGTRLKAIDQQFKTVTQEYADIDDAIRKLNTEIQGIRETQARTPDTVRQVVRDETGALQNRWLIGVGSILFATVGLGLTLLSNESVLAFVRENGVPLGLTMLGICALALLILSRQK